MPNLNNLLVVPIRIPPELVVLICVGLIIAVAGPILSRLWNSVFNPSQKNSPGLPSGPFELRPYLLTEGEHAFLPALEQAIGGRFRIAMKVRLADLVSVSGKDSRSFTARNQTNQKHVDFVLCSHYPVKPLLVIELDDKLHERPEGQRRDSIVDECLAAAGLQILHVPCRQAYDVGQLAADIQSRIGRGMLREGN
jgi:very-short-patch-repair endonuclease